MAPSYRWSRWTAPLSASSCRPARARSTSRIHRACSASASRSAPSPCFWQSRWPSVVGGLGLLRGDELQQRGTALLRLLDAALDGRNDLIGFGDALAVAAERFGHVGVIPRDIRGTVFLGGNGHDLQLDGHAEVVEQDR